jgi:hypothetical protein
MRRVIVGLLVAMLGVWVIAPVSALAASPSTGVPKVVLIVGPSGAATDRYRSEARAAASVARRYTPDVTEIYSPNATWTRVRDALQGANLLIYLGHGNGWPSPYAPFSETSKDGMGLNASAGNGNSNTKYFGEYYMAKLDLAPNAVVLLNRLCYASGNNEWGAGNPTKDTAIKRVDNYGYGFLKAGAKGVFASGITSVSYVLKGLFRASAGTTLAKVFWSDPNKTGDRRFTFNSKRTSGATAIMDPYAAGRYYRSVIGKLDTTVGDWRAGG